MEIVLNFDKKELVIKESSNVEELYKRLKDLLKKDLKNWEIVSDVVYQDNSWWYYQPYQTYPWQPYVTWDTAGTSTATYTNGTTVLPSSGTYCLSDGTVINMAITN